MTANAITRGRMPVLANLAIRSGKPELLAPASSRVVRKASNVITAATLMTAPIAIPATVVTVVTAVTVVTVVIIVFFLSGTLAHDCMVFWHQLKVV